MLAYWPETPPKLPPPPIPLTGFPAFGYHFDSKLMLFSISPEKGIIEKRAMSFGGSTASPLKSINCATG